MPRVKFAATGGLCAKGRLVHLWWVATAAVLSISTLACNAASVRGSRGDAAADVVVSSSSPGAADGDPPGSGASPDASPEASSPSPSPTGVAPAPDDLAGLARLLAQGKLNGWIHGAVHESGLYVFTYRKPNDFFSFAEFPLTAATDDVASQLRQLKRHDAVSIKGSFVASMAPIAHILLQGVTLIASYETDENPTPRTPETMIPEGLAGQTEAIGKVHAIGADGAMLVIEYGDAVVPVFVRVPALTAGLYRNDKIRLAFEFAITPPRPTHLWLDTAAANPLEVLERLVDKSGKPFETDGALVRFPKSEQISVDVYAVQVVDGDRVSREYTLFNADPAIFTAISAKLSAAWRSRPGEAIDGRNKLVNPHIQVHARGTFSIIDPNQANAQILLDSADDVTLSFLP